MKKMQIVIIAAMVFAAAGLLLWSGCSDDNTSGTAGNGQIKMNLIDGPDIAFDNVFIQIVRVEVHQDVADSNSGWIVVGSVPGIYDLLTLTNGMDTVLCDSQLPPGHYTQIRLYLGDNNTVVVAGQTYPLEIPSAQQSGL